MAHLTARERRRLPRSAFGVPERRAYPIENVAHARNALSRVAAHGNPHEKHEVRSKVHARYPQIKCSSCGSPARHMHGKHGCCDNDRCHGMMMHQHAMFGEHGTDFTGFNPMREEREAPRGHMMGQGPLTMGLGTHPLMSKKSKKLGHGQSFFPGEL